MDYDNRIVEDDELANCMECKVPAQEDALDPETKRMIAQHPCFNEQASHLFGRVHLAVAPECNVQCNFCLRNYDCVNESRPGVTSKVLTPAEALERVEQVMATFDHIHTAGIAGPGEPLYNEETFEAFRLVRDEFPNLHFCLSSNGLLLPDKVDILHELGVQTVTVTVSAVDPHIGRQIYSWINYDGVYYRDLQGAEIMLSRQLEGIKMAVERGMLVKVNSVMIPGVNDYHLVKIAEKAAELGAFMQNIMPLIPQYKFAHLKPPSERERDLARDKCSRYIRQMRHCRQCRSDAIGLLGEDLSQNMFDPNKLEGIRVEVPFRVAVTSSATDGMVDLHFGNCPRFLIYEVKEDVFQLIEGRKMELAAGMVDISKAVESLSDCKYVITRKAGPHAVHKLEAAGIELVEDYDTIETAIRKLVEKVANGARV